MVHQVRVDLLVALRAAMVPADLQAAGTAAMAQAGLLARRVHTVQADLRAHQVRMVQVDRRAAGTAAMVQVGLLVHRALMAAVAHPVA